MIINRVPSIASRPGGYPLLYSPESPSTFAASTLNGWMNIPPISECPDGMPVWKLHAHTPSCKPNKPRNNNTQCAICICVAHFWLSLANIVSSFLSNAGRLCLHLYFDLWVSNFSHEGFQRISSFYGGVVLSHMSMYFAWWSECLSHKVQQKMLPTIVKSVGIRKLAIPAIWSKLTRGLFKPLNLS